MIDVHLFSLGWSTSICAFDLTDILHGRRYDVFGVFFLHFLDFLNLHIDISVHINEPRPELFLKNDTEYPFALH